MRKDIADRIVWPKIKDFGFIRVENAVAPAPWTTPSHASMLTGLYPLYHKADHLFSKKIVIYVPKPAQRLLITQSVIKRGYSTILITANPYITTQLGFTGFTKQFTVGWAQFHIPVLNVMDAKKLNRIIAKTGIVGLLMHPQLLLKVLIDRGVLFAWQNVVCRVLSVVKEDSWPKDKGISKVLKIVEQLPQNKPACVLVNLMEVHEPYLSPTLTRKDLLNMILGRTPQIRDKYHEFARYLADKLKLLVKTILEGYEDPLIIVTSDHGQMLGEHNTWGHDRYLYDELLRVPLYIRFPESGPTHTLVDEGWTPLTSIKQLITGEIAGRSFEIGGDTALAEAFVVWEVKGNTIHIKPDYRIAIYHDKYKGVFSVNRKRWLSWTAYDESEQIPDSIKYTMKKLVIKHLRNGKTLGNHNLFKPTGYSRDAECSDPNSREPYHSRCQ